MFVSLEQYSITVYKKNEMLTFFLLSIFPGIRVADQLLCDGAGQHGVGRGALQRPEGGNDVKDTLCSYVYSRTYKELEVNNNKYV